MSRRSLLIVSPVMLATTVAAHAQETRAGVEVAATAGYSNNPYAETSGSSGSAFVAADVTPQLSIKTERSTFTLSGQAHIQEYVNRYPTTDSYRVSGDYRGRPSARVTTFARLDLSSAILGTDDDYVSGGARSIATPAGTSTGTATTPATAPSTGVTQPTLSPDLAGPLVSDIGLLGTRDRRRSLYGTAGLSVAVSAHDALSASGFADLARYQRFGGLSDYNGYGGTIGYSRQVSANLNLGLQGSTSRYDYRGSRGNTSVNSVEATISDRLNQYWTLNGSLGVSFINSAAAGSRNSTSLSGSVNLCRESTRDTLCFQGSRQARATGFNGAQYVTIGGASWRHRIDERSRLTLDGSYLQEGGVTNLNGLQSKYLRVSATYDRQLSQRLRALVSARYRQVFGGTNNQASDYGGQVGLSYRFGAF